MVVAEATSFQAAPTREVGHGFIHHLERFRPQLIAVVAATILSGWAVYRYAVPALVEIAVLVTPPVVPKIMSASTIEAMDRTVFDKTKLSTERQERIREGFNAIAALSIRGQAGYTLNGPNAFALPDGTLVVTDELIELAGDDTEVTVGVLAHEIGHVELEHSLRQIYRAAGVAGLIMMIGGDIGSGTEDLLVQGAGLLSLSYSRGGGKCGRQAFGGADAEGGKGSGGDCPLFRSDRGKARRSWRNQHPVDASRDAGAAQGDPRLCGGVARQGAVSLLDVSSRYSRNENSGPMARCFCLATCL